MGMTIEEIIVKEQEMSEIFQKTVDTHMVSENVSLEELYCDDTEIIEEELKKCQELADIHNQIANVMRKYQKIQTRLDGLEHGMECLLESDPRTFTNRVCENGWLFDTIIEWRKVIREVLEDGNNI